MTSHSEGYRLKKYDVIRHIPIHKTVPRKQRKSRPVSSISATENIEQSKYGSSDEENENKILTTSPVILHHDIEVVDITADVGWDTDLEPDDTTSTGYDGSGKNIYLESCRRSGIIPASYFLRHMDDVQLDMKHHGLGSAGVKPLAVALVSNTKVLKLNLSDNWLGSSGGRHICDMLKENCYISELDLSENNLGTPFARIFLDVLINNNTLTHVSLAGNNFDDLSAEHLAAAIIQTTNLVYLDLSHNMLCEGAGIALGPAVSENSSIRHLDLSWNSIRRRGAIALSKGIKNNVLMQKINLAWNGMGKEGMHALGDALKTNSALEELDISNNRITTEAAVLLGKGIAVNETLKVLKMGQNPMRSAGCYAICAAILRNENCELRELDFSEVLVNTDFYDILKRVKEEKLPNLKVKTGSDGVPVKPRAPVHPMTKLQNYIEKHNVRLVDFFNRFDTDGSMSVTRNEFAMGLQESGLTLTEDEIATLINELDKDGDGEINYSELVIGHQSYSDRDPKKTQPVSNAWTS